jgi:hypothetical protein
MSKLMSEGIIPPVLSNIENQPSVVLPEFVSCFNEDGKCICYWARLGSIPLISDNFIEIP